MHTKGWSRVKKAERRGLFTRLAKRMNQRKANEGPGRSAYKSQVKMLYKGQAEMLTKDLESNCGCLPITRWRCLPMAAPG